MNKLWILIIAILPFFVACSDDDEKEALSNLPDNDMNISVPDSNGEDWYAGMPYQPYPGMPEASQGVEVNVITVDSAVYGDCILTVLQNDAWPWTLSDEDNANLEQLFFPVHADIKYYITEDYQNFNPEKRPCDIINVGWCAYGLDEAEANLKQLENKEKFPTFPLIVMAGGDMSNSFTQEIWDLCIELGGLDYEDDVAPYFGWDPDISLSQEQMPYYYPGNVWAAYITQNLDENGHKEDLIVVGRDDATGNRPGPILCERWICTYGGFDILDVEMSGSRYGSAYVAKIAAEIKRRAPHYTNEDIAQLIFSTAEDLGNPGCDEVYGWGRLNPVAIWNELSNRGY